MNVIKHNEIKTRQKFNNELLKKFLFSVNIF